MYELIKNTLKLDGHVAIAFCAFLIASGNTSAQGWVGADINGRPCEGADSGFGPYDYYEIDETSDPLYEKGRLWEINELHFQKAVRHSQSVPLTQFEYASAERELDYTLRAIPNYPNALQSMSYLEKRRKSEQQKNGVRLTSAHARPECYFQRAIAFRPKTSYLHLLYGNYLFGEKNYDRALEQYEIAEARDPDSAEINYNLGLYYFAVNDIVMARKYADKAYSLGFPLPGLRNKLSKATKAQP